MIDETSPLTLEEIADAIDKLCHDLITANVEGRHRDAFECAWRAAALAHDAYHRTLEASLDEGTNT